MRLTSLAGPVLILLSLAACDGEGSLVRLKAELAVSPDPIVVPPTVRGLESQVEVQLRNTGTTELVVDTIVVDGTEEWDLELPALPLRLAPNATAPVVLAYRPLGEPPPAALVVRSNDGDAPERRVPITASLKQGPVLVLCAAAAGLAERCTDTHATVDLGQLPAGGVGTATVTVRSVGEVAVALESLALGASASAELALPPITTSMMLEPGASVTRMLRVSPGAPGTFQGEVHARAVDRSLSSPSITFTARAEAPATLCASPARLDFGSVAQGDQAVARTTLSACGGGPVTLGALRLTGAELAVVDAPALPHTLAAGQSLELAVRYAPTVAGAVAGELRVDSDVGPALVMLVGRSGFVGMGTLACNDGSTGRSWKDSLAPRPAAQRPGATLAATSGAPAATCSGVPTLTTLPDTTEAPEAALAHGSGRWYFEVTVEEYTAGWSSVGVFAPPASAWNHTAHFMAGVSAASTSPQGVGVLSVVADLDAGWVGFYAGGALVEEAELLVLPGVGAFRAGGISMSGNKLRFNFGAEPFAYGVPAGYSAWAGGAAAGGVCTSDVDVPAPAAAVEVLCDAGQPCAGITTFDSSSGATPELVILGAYDTGSRSSWTWGTDAQGNPVEVSVGPGQNGSTLVEVKRPGRVVLVLSAYEPTDWTVRADANTELVSVSLYGMHLQSVTGVPAGVPVDVHTICTGGDGGNCPGATGENFPIAPHVWPFDLGGGDTQGFVDAMEARFCLPLETFGGAYTARHFVVR